MRLMKLILLYGFSLLYFDLGSLRRRRIELSSSISIGHEFSEEKRKRRRQEKRCLNKKYRPRNNYKKKSLKLQGTHAKDVRYSNQKMLRRMYRNC